MRRCPTCHSSYVESLRFCPHDGSPLEEASADTAQPCEGRSTDRGIGAVRDPVAVASHEAATEPTQWSAAPTGPELVTTDAVVAGTFSPSGRVHVSLPAPAESLVPSGFVPVAVGSAQAAQFRFSDMEPQTSADASPAFQAFPADVIRQPAPSGQEAGEPGGGTLPFTQVQPSEEAQEDADLVPRRGSRTGILVGASAAMVVVAGLAAYGLWGSGTQQPKAEPQAAPAPLPAPDASPKAALERVPQDTGGLIAIPDLEQEKSAQAPGAARPQTPVPTLPTPHAKPSAPQGPAPQPQVVTPTPPAPTPPKAQAPKAPAPQPQAVTAKPPAPTPPKAPAPRPQPKAGGARTAKSAAQAQPPGMQKQAPKPAPPKRRKVDSSTVLDPFGD